MFEKKKHFNDGTFNIHEYTAALKEAILADKIYLSNQGFSSKWSNFAHLYK